jgi:hypothetical protein
MGWLSRVVAWGGGGGMASLGGLGQTIGRIQMEKMSFRFQLNLDFWHDFEKFYKGI